MNVWWWIQAFLVFIEIGMALRYVGVIYDLRVCTIPRKLLLTVGIAGIVILTNYQRNLTMYSRIYLIFCIACCTLIGIVVYRRCKVGILLFMALYFETLYCLDLFLYIAVSIIYPGEDLFSEIHLTVGSGRIGIYLVSRILLFLLMRYIYKKRNIIRNMPLFGGWGWVAIIVIEYVSLYACDRVLVQGWEASAFRNWKLIICLYLILIVWSVLTVIHQRYQALYERMDFQNHLYMSRYEAELKNAQEKDRIYHDMKNHLLIMQKMVADAQYDKLGNYINKLIHPVLTEDASIKTGQDMLDYLLQVKEHEARKKGIVVEAVYTDLCLELRPEELADWCALLGNLWDNAIEACEHVEEGRWIRFALQQIGNAVVVHMHNSCYMKKLQKQNNLLTIKKEKRTHGIGMRSMYYVVNKYHGAFYWECENYIFTVQLTLLL